MDRRSSHGSGARWPLLAAVMATSSHPLHASLLLVYRIPLVFSSCYHLVLQRIKQHYTFYRLHVAYFLFFGLIGSLSLYFSPKPASSLPPLSFVDALFNAVSALTVSGLSSVEMHRFSTSDQVTLLLLMILGSQVFTSVIPLSIRRLSSCNESLAGSVTPTLNHSAKLVGSELQSQPAGKELILRRVISLPPLKNNYTLNAIQRDPLERSPAEEGTRAEHILKITRLNPTFTDVNSFVYSPKSQDCRRSAVDEAADVKKETRILEQEALRTLSWVVLSYFIIAQMIGFVVCELYFLSSPESSAVLTQRHINQGFFSLFSTVSSFANAGYILLDDNLVPLQRSSILLFCFGVLILVGNTMYAPTLRVVIWLLYQSSTGRKRLIYRYLLRNPRKCYTHLFPRSETLWLVVTVAAFNAAQILCICGLDWNSAALKGLGPAYKLVDGSFQSITTRNAGMNVVNIAALSAPTLFLSVGMMYVAVYPVHITRQRSKATVDTGSEEARRNNSENDIYVQSRKLLARDSVYLFVSMFFICLTERNAIKSDPLNFSVFNLLFETVSAYGNVGLSIGYSCSLRQRTSGDAAASCIDVPNSLSGKWSVAGKLILVIIMLLGRHRGLPDNLDRAIAPPRPLARKTQLAASERPGLPLAKPASASCTKKSASLELAVSMVDGSVQLLGTPERR